MPGAIGQRTRVEMVIAAIDQFQRDDLALHPLADLLVSANVATNAVTGEERLAAEQRIAGPLQIRLGLQRADLETVLREPLPVVRLFRLPLRMAKAGRNRHVAVDQRRVGRKDQVGQTA